MRRMCQEVSRLSASLRKYGDVTGGSGRLGCLVIAWVTFLVPIPGIGLFIAWPLNLVAFILAIVQCPNLVPAPVFGSFWRP